MREIKYWDIGEIAFEKFMAKGMGFVPEGEYQISAFSLVMMKMTEGREDIAMFAHLTGTELIVIGDDTTEASIRNL